MKIGIEKVCVYIYMKINTEGSNVVTCCPFIVSSEFQESKRKLMK